MNLNEKTKNFIQSIIHLGYALLLFALLLPVTGAAEDNENNPAIKKYKAAAEKCEKAGKLAEAASYLNKIAFVYWEHNQSDHAITYFNQSLALYQKNDNKQGMASDYSSLGLLFLEKKEYDNALKNIDRSIALRKELKDTKGTVRDLLNKGKVYQAQKKYKAAIKTAEEGLTLAKTVKDDELHKECYEFLYETCEKNGNKSKSLEYFKAYSALEKHLEEESFSQKEHEAQVQLEELSNKTEEEEQVIQEKEMELQKQHEILQSTEDSLRRVEEMNKIKSAEIALLNIEKERKELAIKEKELEIKHKDEELRHERVVQYMILGMLAMTACFGLIAFQNYRRKVKDHKLLQKQATEIERKSNELEQAVEIIKEKNHKITSSINYAQRIQQAMLPASNLLKNSLNESFILFKPRDIVSGDFYWFLESQNTLEDDFIITAIDCTGHGVPGAFMSMIGYNLLNEINRRGITETNVILEELHTGIRKALKQDTTENRDGMDMALCKVRLKERIVEFSGAKNPLYYIQNGALTHIKGDPTPIGGMQKEEKREFSRHSIPIDGPTTFYMFSDGYADQFGGDKGMKFMYSKFKDLLIQIHHLPMEEQKQILDKTIEEWKGDKHKQIDDILVIGFRIE